MQMKVTIKDVARKAGVSPSTASRVAGNYGYVSEKNRRKVLSAVRDMGYRPNAIARSMVTKATQTIGLVVTDILNPFFAHLTRGIEEITWQAGYTLILANTDEDIKHEEAVLHALQEKQVDGLIIIPASSNPSALLVNLYESGTPIVLLDRMVKDLSTDVILVDNEHGAYLAVSHLLEMGHRRIAMVIDNLDISTNTERLIGYRKALKEWDVPVVEELVQSCQYTQQSAYLIVKNMLAQTEAPTALFTANNFLTIGALQALRELELNIPQDISLVGFDDLEWIGLNSPGLTTVAQPMHEMGRVAAQRLISRLNGEQTPPLEIRLKTQFIIRQSTRQIAEVNSIIVEPHG